MHLRKRTLDLHKKNENKCKDYMEINHELLADENIADIESTVLTDILIKSLVTQQRDIITMKPMGSVSVLNQLEIYGYLLHGGKVNSWIKGSKTIPLDWAYH